jgi:NTP pyrophosphatase (non-canonical NTP hydrolase)
MDFDKYQHDARQTAVYPRPDVSERYSAIYASDDVKAGAALIPVMYCVLGLTGEAGEVAEQVKKSWRNDMEISPERRMKIRDELGDVMWYVSNLATELGMSLDDIARLNIQKLVKRQEKGELKKA